MHARRIVLVSSELMASSRLAGVARGLGDTLDVRASPAVVATEEHHKQQQQQTSLLGRLFGWGKSKDADDATVIAKLRNEAEQ